MNNNFRQNPEYFFFKTKRESFRNHNLLVKLDLLGIKLEEEEIFEEIENNKINKNKITEKSLFSISLEKNNYSDNLNFDLSNKENLTITDRIKIILQGNVKEYIPKTFKIIVKENKTD